jgi:predicted TIM-barrel fold metal-dependent hydrolase
MLPFVDAHVHLWDLDNIQYPWLQPPFGGGPNGDVSPIARNYLLEDYLADASDWDVRAIVHVQAGAHPSAARTETRWLQAMADKQGMPQAIVGFAALNDPDVESLLEFHASHENVRGIRHIVNWHDNPAKTYTPRDITSDAQWTAGFGLLGKYGLSFDLQAYPGQFAGLAQLIGRHPEIPVIIDHAGMPVDTDEAGKSLWDEGMKKLAALPNVAVKLSGFGFIHRDWTVAQIRPYVLTTIEIFGTKRCLVASDFPTDKLFGSFNKHLAAYDELTRSFSEDERLDLFGRNAARIYRINLNF